MEGVIVTKYHVNECGYYLDGDYCFGDLDDVIDGLESWLSGLNAIGESSTYTPTQDDTYLRAFCLDFRRLADPNRVLVATWNETERTEDGVQLLDAHSQIGAAAVTAVEIDEESLPGYPAYFCLDLQSGEILNLRFEQRLNGSQQFQRYISGFLASKSQWCWWSEDDEEELLGYGEGEDSIDSSLEPRFSTRLARLPGRLEALKARSAEVRRLIRRISANPRIETERPFLDRAFDFLGLNLGNRRSADIRVEYKMKMKLTPAQMESLLERVSLDRAAKFEGDDPWDDVGFVLAGESSKIHWMSGSIARAEHHLDVSRDERGLVDMDSLVVCLNERYEAISTPLK